MFANPALRGWAQFGDSVLKGRALERGLVMTLLGAKIAFDIMAREESDGLTDEQIARGGLTFFSGSSYGEGGEKLKDYSFKFPIDRSISDAGGFISLGIMQIMKEADDREGTKGSLSRTLSYFTEFFPQLTPLITMSYDVLEYTTTGNIENSFGYKILTSDEEYLSFGENKGKLARHALQSLGVASIIGKRSTDYITGNTKSEARRKLLEKKESAGTVDNLFVSYARAMREASAIPIVGAVANRFAKESNYGEVEIYNNLIDDARSVKAKDRVEAKKAVERLLLGKEEPEDWATIIRFPDKKLASILAGLDNTSALNSSLSRVPSYDKETQAKIIMDYIERRK